MYQSSIQRPREIEVDWRRNQAEKKLHVLLFWVSHWFLQIKKLKGLPSIITELETINEHIP
jgi:hypothetical protein